MGGSGRWGDEPAGPRPRPGAYSDAAYGAGRTRPPPGGPYGGPYSPPGYGSPRRAGIALTLGILGLVVCGLLAPFAWVYSASAVEDNLGTPNEGIARAGQILGIVGTALLVLGFLGVLLILLATT